MKPSKNQQAPEVCKSRTPGPTSPPTRQEPALIPWRKTPAGKAWLKAYQKRWASSSSGKAWMKSYMKKYGSPWQKTPDGKAYKKLYMKKYNNSVRAKRMKRKWAKSPEGKKYRSWQQKIYGKTLGGKIVTARYKRSTKGKDVARMLQDKRKRNCIIIEHVDKKILLDLYEWTCPFCGKKLRNDYTTHIDHLIPVIRYIAIGRKFPYKYSTVAPLHAKCNVKKARATPLEYFWKNGG